MKPTKPLRPKTVTDGAQLIIWFVFLLGAASLLFAGFLAIKGNAAYKDFVAVGGTGAISGLIGMLARIRPDPEAKANSGDSSAEIKSPD